MHGRPHLARGVDAPEDATSSRCSEGIGGEVRVETWRRQARGTMEGAVACPKVASEDDGEFCILDEVQADIARDALQHFAILSGKDDKTKGRILRASKALQRLLNYDLDTPFPRDLSVFWGANTDRSTIDEINASIKANRPYSGEVLCYKHTGQTLWCEISLQAIAINQDAPRNGTVCIACFIRDIDEIHCAVRVCLALPLEQRRKHL